MKTVALLGGAELTRGAIKDTQADEIWNLNWAYKYDYVPRIDRLFEMHPVWMYAKTDKEAWKKPRDHWKWLQKPHPFPIYMLYGLPMVPACVRYPIEAVTEDLFGGNLWRGDSIFDVYTSSFDYMIALAIHERWNVIDIYGFEMGSTTEYRYQREGAALMIGIAIARGITVKLQGNSVLLKSKRYGYNGGQMIFRQDLEQAYLEYQKNKQELMGKLQHLEGVYSVTGDEQVRVKMQDARDRAAIAAGGCAAIEYLIKFIDLEEPEINIDSPFATIAIEEGNHGTG